MRGEISAGLGITDAALEEFCRRWKITELSRFGSALREDFGRKAILTCLCGTGRLSDSVWLTIFVWSRNRPSCWGGRLIW